MDTMTHNKLIFAPKIALYEPDIPQNTAAIIRTCSCLGATLEIIEPCGFLFSDKRFKRVVMDYMNLKEIKFEDTSLQLGFKGKGAFSGELEHWHDDTFILYFDGGDGQAYESTLITFKIDNNNVIGINLGAFGNYNRIR